MNNYSKIYWLTRLDALQHLFEGMLLVATMCLIIYFICLFVNFDMWDKEEEAAFRKRWRASRITAISLIIVASIGLSFMPTRNEAILIMVGGKTLDYAQADTSLSKLPYQTTAYISQYMENALKELKRD